jgi:membrane-associated phospholipid phosphatase
MSAMVINSLYTKQEVSLFINANNTAFLDLFFKYTTFLGDGWFFFIVSILLFFVNKQYGAYALTCFVISTLIAQGLKHFVFDDYLRPIMILKDATLHLVPGVEVHEYNSFPSGHSTSAFALCCLFSLLTTNSRAKVMLLIIAVITAFSRIYLLQHFLEDTIAGSFIGVFTSTFVYLLFVKRRWLDRYITRKAKTSSKQKKQTDDTFSSNQF